MTGAGADALVRERLRALDDAAEAVGAQSPDAVPARIARAPGRAPRGEAAAQGRRRSRRSRSPASSSRGAEEVAPGVRLVGAALPYDSMDALKAAARDVSAALGSGVVALALDADEPQLFVTVSDDLVARGISAGDLVDAAMPALDGRGGGRPQMAQGKGTLPRRVGGGPRRSSGAARDAEA